MSGCVSTGFYSMYISVTACFQLHCAAFCLRSDYFFIFFFKEKYIFLWTAVTTVEVTEHIFSSFVKH